MAAMTGRILLPSYPLTYPLINIHVKYGSNPIRIIYVTLRKM